MGRSIRRVPPDWVHPKVNGKYVPVHDQCYTAAVADWDYQAELWARHEHPQQASDDTIGIGTWQEWAVDRPDPAYYRQSCWNESECTHFQIYENITEGTPLSPVLPDLAAVRAWLVDAGYGRVATEELLNTFYLPTFYAMSSPPPSRADAKSGRGRRCTGPQGTFQTVSESTLNLRQLVVTLLGS